MPVTDVRKDPDALTMTITAELDASIDRVWQLWADPRQLERWWGPPTHPATVEQHDLSVGGRVSYYMTSPEGERYHGYWEVLEVDAPRRLVVRDGFADADGAPNEAMPESGMTVSVEPGEGGGTRMTIASTFASRESMDQMVAMGMEEGITAAMGQMDALLAEPLTMG